MYQCFPQPDTNPQKGICQVTYFILLCRQKNQKYFLFVLFAEKVRKTLLAGKSTYFAPLVSRVITPLPVIRRVSPDNFATQNLTVLFLACMEARQNQDFIRHFVQRNRGTKENRKKCYLKSHEELVIFVRGVFGE